MNKEEKSPNAWHWGYSAKSLQTIFALFVLSFIGQKSYAGIIFDIKCGTFKNLMYQGNAETSNELNLYTLNMRFGKIESNSLGYNIEISKDSYSRDTYGSPSYPNHTHEDINVSYVAFIFDKIYIKKYGYVKNGLGLATVILRTQDDINIIKFLRSYSYKINNNIYATIEIGLDFPLDIYIKTGLSFGSFKNLITAK